MYNKRNLIKGYSVPREFSWIENYKLFDNIIHEQKDGVSMGESLGPVLANIIMTECEKVIVDNLVKEGTIKFYVCYVNVFLTSRNLTNCYNFFIIAAIPVARHTSYKLELLKLSPSGHLPAQSQQ